MHRMKGISLMEVVGTLAIAALSLGMGLPALARVIDRTRIAHVQTALSDSALTASRLAVATGSATVICPANEAGRCSETLDWSAGWLVFVDSDGDFRTGGDDTVIRRFGAVDSSLRIYSTQGRKRIVFQPQGDSAGSNVTFTICGRRNSAIGLLVLSNAGRFRIAEPDSSKHVPRCAQHRG